MINNSGNCEDKNVSDLYQLKDEYVGLPAQAIECSLNGCTISSTEWVRICFAPYP